MKKNNTNNQLISLPEFNEFLFSNIIPIKDIYDYEENPITKLLPYWRRHGLLPFFQKGKWSIEISFAQLIWLRILDTFRQFGVPLESSKKACDYFFKDAYDIGLPEKNLKANKDLIEKKNTAGTSSEEDVKLLEQIIKMLDDDVLLYGLKFEINFLTMLITDCIASETDAGFMVFPDGDVYEYLGEKYFTHRKKELDLTKPHIRLSVRHYLKEFIIDDDLQKIFIPTILDDNEKEVLKVLRQNNTSITIKKQNGEIVKIESSKEGTITESKAREIRNILGLRNYEEITISTRDEKTLTFKKVKKMNRLR